jgi:hypothetical protein
MAFLGVPSTTGTNANQLLIYNRVNHGIVFGTNNTERLRVTAAGDVGIGTASPAAKLHVAGAIFNTGGATFYRQANTSSNNGLILGTVAKATSPTGGQGAIFIQSNDASNVLEGGMSLITDATAGNRRLQIQVIEQNVAFRNITLAESGGNVGIGKTPTSGRLLDVNGDTWLYDVRVGRGGSGITSNTAVGGANTLFANTTGSSNTAVGYNSLPVNTTGYGNTAIGRSALEGNTTGNFNTALGAHVPGSVGGPLQSNTTGGANTAIGVGTLFSNTTATDNTAVGYLNSYNNTTGSYCTSVGSQALRNNTTAAYNTAVGFASLYSATTGAGNNGFGFYSGYGITTGIGNNCIGYYSGFSLTTGNYNVLIGEQAGYYSIATTTGFHNTYIGGLVRGSAGTNNNEIVIGYDTAGKGSSTGVINPAGGSMYQGNNTTTWATTSDRRIKKNIVDNNDGLAKINSLRVRNFEYRTEDEIDPELPKSAAIKTSGVQIGVIAQEIREVLPECVKEESTGVLSVNSDRLIWHLVNAVKELSAEIALIKSKLGE